MRAIALLLALLALSCVHWPAQAGGRIERMEVASAIYGETLAVDVYLPDPPPLAQPTLVVYSPSAALYLREGSAVRTWLDAAATAGTPVVLVALPDPGHEATGRALARLQEEEADRHARFVATELVPTVEHRHNLAVSPARRVLLGFSSGAVRALDLALARPDLFGRIAAQSPGWMIWDPERAAIGEDFTTAALARVVAHCKGLAALQSWFVWGEARTDEWERRSREANAPRVLAALRACGADVVVAPAVAGGHGLGLIDASLAGAIAFLSAADGTAR